AQDLRDRNALLPVHQLPVEVLADIFQETFDEDSGYFDSRLEQYKKLSHVCYRWQTVLDNSPGLWSRIDGKDPSALVDEALKKSSNRLLNFSFCTQVTHEPHKLASFLQKLDPHLNRLRNVRINFQSDFLPKSHLTTVKLFTSPQPSLERLYLRDLLFQTDLSRLELFADHAPRLKDLYLNGIAFNCRGAIFGRLNDLSLFNASIPSINALLGSISCCGELLNLQLNNIWVLGVGTDPPPGPISLPVLRSLSLGSMPLALEEGLLRDIQAPQSSCFALSLKGCPVDLEMLLLRYAPKWLLKRSPFPPEITKVDIEVTEFRLLLTFFHANDSERSNLFLSHAQDVGTCCGVLRGVTAFLKSYVPKADIHLTLGCTAFHLAEDGSYVEQLSCLSQTTVLRLGQPWSSWQRNYWESDGAQNFQLPAFPRLQNLSFHQQPSDWIIKIVRMLSAHPERECGSRCIAVAIYVWKDSELDEMSSAAEKIKEIVGVERVVVSVSPESKKKGQNLG
ncbi:hypothetical protein FRC01_007339, partial [Tulasnella sp. 417]